MATKRLIDANRLKMRMIAFATAIKREYLSIEAIVDTINTEDTVDAVEVVHGRWEFVPSEKYGRHYTDAICTACKAVLDTHCDNDLEYRQEKIKKKLLYCPNCGAKMDGDGNG